MVETASSEIKNKILKTLEGGPKYIKQISDIASISPNTVGKYVDILAQSGEIKIEKYATAKLVSLNKKR